MVRGKWVLAAAVVAGGVMGMARGGDGPGEGMQMPPEVAAMMEPGEMHKKLAPMAGRWTFETKMWMDPAAPPMVATGTARAEWILGGRYLMTHIDSPEGLMGDRFQGMAVVGYDNAQKRYHSTWYDTMGTGVMVMTGRVDETGKVFTWEGENYDMMEGRMVKSRLVSRLVDGDTMTEEMWVWGPGGEEMKVMEIRYARMK